MHLWTDHVIVQAIQSRTTLSSQLVTAHPTIKLCGKWNLSRRSPRNLKKPETSQEREEQQDYHIISLCNIDFQRIRNLVRSGDFPSTRKKVKDSSMSMPALQHEAAGISSWILCQLLYFCLQYQSHLFPSNVLGHISCWCKPALVLKRQRYLTADSSWLSSYCDHLSFSVSIVVTQQANLESCRTGSVVELFYNMPALLWICCTPFTSW